MWLFTPDGFFSAVQHKTDPTKIMIRTRSRVHAQTLADACRDGAKPEIMETLPPADYRFRVTVSREQWVYLVARFAAEIAYTNFKTEAGSRKHPPGFMHVLHTVWADLLAFQDDMYPPKGKKGKKGQKPKADRAGADADPFDDLDLDLLQWSSQGASQGASANEEGVDLAEGMIVQRVDGDDEAEGEVISVDEGRRVAEVLFTTHLTDGKVEYSSVTLPYEELVLIYDPFSEGVVDLDPMEDDDLVLLDDDDDDDGSWPLPKTKGWMRGS